MLMENKKIISRNSFFNNNRPGYKTYKIIPDFTIENNQNEVIARAISTLYKTPLERFEIDIKGIKFTYTAKRKVIFDILLVPENAYFYFTVPIESEELFLNKIKSIWNNSAIIEVTKEELYMLNNFNSSNSLVTRLISKTFNFKSLSTDKGDLYPLTNMIGIVTSLKAELNEMARLNFSIEPIKRRNWVAKAKDEYEAYKKGKSCDREKTAKENIADYVFKTFEFAINFYIEFRLLIFESLLGIVVPKEKENEKIEVIMDSVAAAKEENEYIGLSSSTIYKMTSEAFNVGITLLSKSKDIDRRNINMLAVANSYKDLNGDNEIVIKKLNEKEQKKAIKNVVYLNDMIPAGHKSIYSDKEVAKFIQMPQKHLQQLYKIDNIDKRELEVPRELLEGNIPIGQVEVKREVKTAYWSNNKNILSLPKIVIGPMGSGKSEYTKSFAINAAKKGDSVVVFDYIKECELSNDISKHIDCIKIDLSKEENLMALAYPELQPIGSDWERLKVANILARQTEYLINSLSPEPLTPRMSRYLDAASKVAYIHPNAKVEDVIDVLVNWKVRNEYIRRAKYSGIFKEDDIEILDLDSLHERDKGGKIIGTKESKLEGIIDRINILMKDIYLRAMCKADIDYNQNFCKWMDQGKTILIQMPQDTFTNKQVNDTIVTYFMSRVWLAALQRESTRIVHVITDEIHQVPTAAKFVSDIITEARKFGIDFYFTIHYLKQFRALHDAVRSAGASYMILAGTEKENLIALREEIQPFALEEGLNIESFYSLNIVNYGNQYAKFISKLPKMI